MAKNPSYPPEFRRKIVDLVRSGRPARAVAQEFQLSRQSISNGNANGVGMSTFTTISAPGKADTFAFPSPYPAGNFITAIYTPQGGSGGPTGICSAAN